MNHILNGIIFLGSAVLMEGVAWAVHKYVMHGFLWVLHEDHHHTSGRRLQKNDLFALFFATLSFLLIYNGLSRSIAPLAASGFGVALYGAGYFTFHDIMFHRRIKAIHYKPRTRYLRRIIAAHRVHHRVAAKTGGTSFGFLYAPKHYAEAD